MKKIGLYILMLVTANSMANQARASRDTVMYFSYNAISCTCAQWSESSDTSDERRYYYLEATNNQLINADRLWKDNNLPLQVRVKGKIISENGYPKNIESTKGQPSPGKVFRYSDISIVANGKTTNLKSMVDSLAFVTGMPYICDIGSPGCGDKLFWNVVRQKQNVIPLLIDKLPDTTTTLAPVNFFGGQWAVGDIAFAALKELIKNIPTFELLGIPFDTNGCGYCAYWDQVRESRDNRTRFQSALQKWYDTNKNKLVWVESNDFQICDCRGPHPNGGHFEVLE